MFVAAYWLMFQITVLDYINVYDIWLLTGLNFLEALSISSHWSWNDLDHKWNAFSFHRKNLKTWSRRQRIDRQPLAGHHILMTSWGLTRHDERTLSVLVRSWQSWFDLANILHADCTSHGNVRINKTTRPVDFITPSTHGLQQYREDTPVHGDSIVAVLSWRYVRDDVYGDSSLTVCRLTLHPWRLFWVVQNTVLTDRSRDHPQRSDRN